MIQGASDIIGLLVCRSTPQTHPPYPYDPLDFFHDDVKADKRPHCKTQIPDSSDSENSESEWETVTSRGTGNNGEHSGTLHKRRKTVTGIDYTLVHRPKHTADMNAVSELESSSSDEDGFKLVHRPKNPKAEAVEPPTQGVPMIAEGYFTYLDTDFNAAERFLQNGIDPDSTVKATSGPSSTNTPSNATPASTSTGDGFTNVPLNEPEEESWTDWDWVV